MYRIVFAICTAQCLLYVPHSVCYMYRTVVAICTAQWLLYVPQTLTSKIPSFCPHSEFVCSEKISEQTAIISLHSINWLVFIIKMQCVYCRVRTGYLNVIHGKVVPPVAPVRSQVSQYENGGAPSSDVTGFSPSTSVFPCQYHSTDAPYSSSYTRCTYRKDKWEKPAKPFQKWWRSSFFFFWTGHPAVLENWNTIINLFYSNTTICCPYCCTVHLVDSLIITQPTNALIVCHLFLNHFHCSYMFR